MPYEYREAPLSEGVEDVEASGAHMGASRKALLIASLLFSSTMSSGCLALSIQREIMESWREPPVYIDEDVTVGWSETFETGTELDSVLYTNTTNLVFDETVSSLVINFRAQFPYSATLEDLIGNETNQVRYVEARLWEPGTQQTGGVPFWEVRATQDYPGERWDWQIDFIEGTWVLEVEARGWGGNHTGRATVVPRLIRPVCYHDQALRALPQLSRGHCRWRDGVHLPLRTGRLSLWASSPSA